MEALNTGVLTILGIGVFGGIIGAALFQRLRFPQVVGYIAMGLLIGDVGLGIVSVEDVRQLQPLNLFALGIIGFLVGGELQLSTLRAQGKQLISILLWEGLTAFVIVGLISGIVVYVIAGNVPVALAAGLVFGAIASPTDPASTLSVLWEYRSRGALTTTLIAIVALDDALAMTLYGISTSAAAILTGSGASIGGEILKTGASLGGAVVLGVASGYVFKYVMSWLNRPESTFASAMGAILLIIGIAEYFHMDVILAAMMLGVTLTNIAPRLSKDLFNTVRSFATPIYVIFFVLVGARLDISSMPGWLWLIVALYVIGRSVGKIVGAYIGARTTGAEPVVQKYTGLGLFAQGGIAVGLSIMAGHQLAGVAVTETLSLGDMVIFSVTASTLVLQITGPSLTKLASRFAGELGRDVKEEDVIDSWAVSDVMKDDIVPITQGTPLSRVIDIFASNHHLVYPVVDKDGRLAGVITLDDLKGILTSQDTWDWVLANDVMVQAVDKTSPKTPLKEALAFMNGRGIEEMPVVSDDSEQRSLGMIDQRSTRIRINDELVRRRQAT